MVTELRSYAGLRTESPQIFFFCKFLSISYVARLSFSIRNLVIDQNKKLKRFNFRQLILSVIMWWAGDHSAHAWRII